MSRYQGCALRILGNVPEAQPMDDTVETLEQPPARRGVVPRHRGLVRGLAFLPVVCFSPFLADLAKFSWGSELFSHILLIPFIVGFLVWEKRSSLPRPVPGASFSVFLSLASGFVLLSAYLILKFNGAALTEADSLVLVTASFLLFEYAALAFRFGLPFLRVIAFPIAFLIFIVPFPEAVTNVLETASKYASAELYAWMMELSRATFFRDGLVFALPNLTIEVAQECSGIRSSFVLFLTSLLAGHMFLRNGRNKVLLAFLVFPLGILRNAFRIYVLSMLSVHWDPGVIHSPLHHRGGPIFFILSLIPFFGALFWLRRAEDRHGPLPSSPLATHSVR
ncbi:MAG TPA: exosortase/archaeosortase family protein [Verrucomicrobiae bacterium]|nr:exosortase/archaeosortase family protein [Verrucomicrobiae bacterium]